MSKDIDRKEPNNPLHWGTGISKGRQNLNAEYAMNSPNNYCCVYGTQRTHSMTI